MAYNTDYDHEVARQEEMESIMNFWGMGPVTPVDESVRIWRDESIISDKFSETDTAVDDEGRITGNLVRGNARERMGTASATNKEQRMFMLRAGIDSGKVSTVEEAMSYLLEKGHSVGEGAIINYLSSMQYQLVNNEGETVGASDVEVRRRIKNETSYAAKNFKYYDKDPAEGGQRISREQYLAQYR